MLFWGYTVYRVGNWNCPPTVVEGTVPVPYPVHSNEIFQRVFKRKSCKLILNFIIVPILKIKDPVSVFQFVIDYIDLLFVVSAKNSQQIFIKFIFLGSAGNSKWLKMTQLSSDRVVHYLWLHTTRSEDSLVLSIGQP